MKSLIRVVFGGIFALAASLANATVIYFADENGHVGRYDDATTALSAVGNAGATFTVGQIIGIAWDPTVGRILLLDRNATTVYAMNPTSGAVTLLFNPGIPFQGGAVVGTTLFGIDETTQTIEAFSLSTFANLNLSAAALTSHTHGMGVNPATGQLYIGISGDLAIKQATTLGAQGPVVVTESPGAFAEDVDYYGGDFLASVFGANVITRVNGTTGVATQFLSTAQIVSAGVTGNVSGVAVAGAAAPPPQAAPIPSLNEWGVILLGMLVAATAVLLLRRTHG
jgi:hypothetical protein